MMKRWTTALLAGVMLTATACSTADPGPGAKPPDPSPAACSPAEPPAEDAVARGAWLVPSTEKAKAGEELEFTIQTATQGVEITRGIAGTLECWTGTQWLATHTLVSGSSPAAYPITEQVAVIDIALIGPGPERIKLPEGLTPGAYRIRKDVNVTANGQGQNFVAYGKIQVIE